MEKLSSLTINRSCSLKKINFDGFRLSEGWVGFFERVKPFSVKFVDEAIDVFLDYFKSELSDFFAISALSFNDNAEYDEEIIKEYGDIYDKAKAYGYLCPLTESFECYRFGENPLCAKDISVHFDNEMFMDISRLIMAHGGVNGQVFFLINLKIGVAIYPHDDTGFGCISLNGIHDVCLGFLKRVEENDNFRVIIDY